MKATRPHPPENLAGGVGHGDFWAIGEENTALIQMLAGPLHAERVLDVGCGLGRTAWPLAQVLDEASTYVGFDTSLRYVDWCRSGLGLDPARFDFEYHPLYSSLYNPGAKTRAEDFQFPWPDESFTLVIATSLFTHLTTPATVNYLNQIGRVLKPGGRVVASFFLLDEWSERVMNESPAYPNFKVRFPEGMLASASSPEDGVAYEAMWLLQALRNAGLEYAEWRPGRWRRIDGTSYQDFVLMRKD